MIQLNGKTVLLYDNYTFSKQGPSICHQYCSKKLTCKCPAKITLDKLGGIKNANTNHNHPPPKIICTANGQYFRV